MASVGESPAGAAEPSVSVKLTAATQTDSGNLYAVTDFQGRIYQLNAQNAGESRLQYKYPIDTTLPNSDLSPSINLIGIQNHWYYVDGNGYMRWTDPGNGTDEIVTGSTNTFKPNTTIGNDTFHVSDRNGKLWYLSDTTLTPLTGNGSQLTTAPNVSVSATLKDIITDSRGRIWRLDGSTATQETSPAGVALKPNQFNDNGSDGIGEWYYTNSSGVLVSPTGTLLPRVKGLTPGLIFPMQYLLIADGAGTLWHADYDRASKITGATFAPGTFGYASPWSIGYLWAIDSQGYLYQNNYDNASFNKLRKVSEVRFTSPNQLAVAIAGSQETPGFSVALAGAEDGTIYMLQSETQYNSGGNRIPAPARIIPSGLYWKNPGGSTDSGTCVAQMPTTGDPKGLNAIAMAAVSAGLFAVVVGLRKRLS